MDPRATGRLIPVEASGTLGLDQTSHYFQLHQIFGQVIDMDLVEILGRPLLQGRPQTTHALSPNICSYNYQTPGTETRGSFWELQPLIAPDRWKPSVDTQVSELEQLKPSTLPVGETTDPLGVRGSSAGASAPSIGLQPDGLDLLLF